MLGAGTYQCQQGSFMTCAVVRHGPITGHVPKWEQGVLAEELRNNLTIIHHRYGPPHGVVDKFVV